MSKIVIVLFFLLSACSNSSDHVNERIERPSSAELKYRIGDCLAFRSGDSTYGCVTICDFSKDSGGIWYGIFYSGYDSTLIPTIPLIIGGKVMGRKVESSIDKEGYKSCVDGDFIHDSLFTNKKYFTLIGNIPLKIDVHLGSHGAINAMPGVILSFHRGKSLRMKPPDHYKEHLVKLNSFHPEEYFRMIDFVVKK